MKKSETPPTALLRWPGARVRRWPPDADTKREAATPPFARDRLHIGAMSNVIVSTELQIGLTVLVLSAAIVLVIASLPESSFTSILNIDDSFYYAQIARRLSLGQFSTFDGQHLTNGYHPLWAAMLAPVFSGIRDPVLALRMIKSMELELLLLAALLIMVSARRSGWAIPMMLIVPLSLLSTPVLYQGMETSIQVLLFSGVLFCITEVWTDRGQTPAILMLGIICALLPWARLESMSVGILAISVVSIRAVVAGSGHWRAILIGWMLLGFSLIGYFVYNEHTFGSPVPVSGAIKNYWSSLRFAEEGGWSPIANARSYYWSQHRRIAACVLVVALVGLPWLFSAYRSRKYDSQKPIDVFILIMVVAYFARLIYSAVFVHVIYDNSYYYTPFFVVQALTVPYVLSRLALLASTISDRPSVSHARAALVISGAALLMVGLQARPWTLLAQWRRTDAAPTWLDASYDGARWMNRHLPADAVVGSPDSGVVGYFTQRRVINLDGLVNDASFFAAMKAQRVERWIHDARVTYLANGVRADVSDGCAAMAAGSVQTRPYSGSCKLVYAGLRFRQGWRGRADDMQFRVYAYTPPK